jgi:hypothetical protein
MPSPTAQLLAAWRVFALATPAAHLAALYVTAPKRGARLPPLAALAWPAAGGPRCLVFQSLAWTAWSAAALVALPPLQARRAGGDAELLAAAAALGAAAALLFLLKSVAAFEPARRRAGAKPLARLRRAGRAAVEWDASRLGSPAARAALVCLLGLLWAVLGAALLLAAASRQLAGSGPARGAAHAAAAACFTVAVASTHGLGGHLRHRRGDAPWRFYNPWAGGAIFVATQALGWFFYSAALAAVLWAAAAAAAGAAHGLARGGATAAAAAALAAEALLAGSLLAYAPALKRPAPPLRERVRSLATAARNVCVIALLYNQVHILLAVVLLSFAAAPPLLMLALWAGGLTIYFALTGAGAEVDGRRDWPAFRHWLGAAAEEALAAALGSFEVRAAPGAVFESNKKYVFGYAPHSLFPLGAAALSIAPAFRRLLPPGLSVPTLTASVVFQVPLCRDLLLWAGCRSVGRGAFERVLRERGAALVVPGGQAEMVEAGRAFPAGAWGAARVRRARGAGAECVLYTRHLGFARVAAHAGAALVPVLALGELTALGNLWPWPAAQRWTYKRLGFPAPYLLGGRGGGTLPLPSRTGLRFVVGVPIAPPAPPAGAPAPTEAQVRAFHGAFYDAIEALWRAHAADFPGYEAMRLVRV